MKNKCIVEVFSRVTGFFRPVEEWNAGKREEFSERKKMNIETAMAKGEDGKDSKAETVSG